jgi:cob(I)alamin adenosyltransferase
MKIYTKTGDDGTTGLFGGERVHKHALRIDAYGNVDELNSFLGHALRASAHEPLSALLIRVQRDLFLLGADLATPASVDAPRIERVAEKHVTALEHMIDDLETELPEIRFFILPGGGELAARLHICRAVCRRAERATAALAAVEQINEFDLQYLNRLSDALFVLARHANHLEGVAEQPWK